MLYVYAQCVYILDMVSDALRAGWAVLVQIVWR